MHQLGNEISKEKKAEIKTILTARKAFCQAGIALLECDGLFAENVKHSLEQMTFASKIVQIVGAGGLTIPLDAAAICFYLEIDYRICVQKENITVDFENQRCLIQLNDTLTAEVPIKDGIGIKSLTPLKEQ